MRKMILCIVLTAAIMLCGCEKSIFINTDANYTLTRVSASDLEYEKYYVKDGSSFYQLYQGKTQGNGFYVIEKEITLIPDYYGGELIAFRSTKLSMPESIPLQRMKDAGYTFGIFGITKKNDGYYFNADKNTLKGYNAQNVFKRTASAEILLLTIDDKPVSEYELTDMGTFDGLTENQSYSITCMAGTEYLTGTLVADVHTFIPFEDYEISDVSTTRNGYAAFRMDKEAKSGYYVISGQGMFRFHQEEKGKTPEVEDFSISNYDSPEDMLNARYQQQAIIVSTMTYSVGFNVKIADKDKDKNVKCVLMSPSGELYDLTYDKTTGTADILLAEVEAGRWTMNIYPKNISVEKVNVDKTSSKSEAMLYEKTITADEIIEKARFTVTYTGTGTIWGTVTNKATSESKAFTASRDGVYCDWSRLVPGDYEIMVYHYVDTFISDVELKDISKGGAGEVIVIEN
ncbi:MAG: hypothetical protein J6Y89_00810 [Lachnospiraceae bacterium]|nr:hypothetical protein [Lachnospiraceae bacterium]